MSKFHGFRFLLAGSLACLLMLVLPALSGVASAQDQVSVVIGLEPQIAPKKHGVVWLWQSGMRCRKRPM